MASDLLASILSRLRRELEIVDLEQQPELDGFRSCVVKSGDDLNRVIQVIDDSSLVQQYRVLAASVLSDPVDRRNAMVTVDASGESPKVVHIWQLLDYMRRRFDGLLWDEAMGFRLHLKA